MGMNGVQRCEKLSALPPLHPPLGLNKDQPGQAYINEISIQIPLGVENTQKNFLDQRWSYARFEVQFSHGLQYTNQAIQILPCNFGFAAEQRTIIVCFCLFVIFQ